MTDETISADELEFMTKTKFNKIVESVVASKNLSYMDAIIYSCEQYGIELEDSRKYVSNVLKRRLEVEAMNLNFLEKVGSLPVE